MQLNFSKNYLQFGYVPSKRFAFPTLDRKSLKNISFKDTTVNLPGAPSPTSNVAMFICVYPSEYYMHSLPHFCKTQYDNANEDISW
jgi:hypothetical protein